MSDIIFQKKVVFKNNKDENFNITLENTYFEELNIYNCEIDIFIFKGDKNEFNKLKIFSSKFKGVTINSNLKGSLEFNQCIFNDFNLYNADKNTEINGDFIFDACEVLTVANFKHFIFNGVANFKNSKFRKIIYFNNSIFHKYADFHECEFEKNACFYGVTFGQTPNFSQAIFKDNLNLVNTNLDFSFEDLETKINSEYESYNKNKADNEKKSLEKFTNDFRDSFRNFKSISIKEHNVLDALNYHKFELYCKEIELKQKWSKKGIEAKNEIDIRKNTLKFKEFVDSCLLYFYRKLCDHHTDFLRVFNNLILLIALYALFAYIICDCQLLKKVKSSDIIFKCINMLTNIKELFMEKNENIVLIITLILFSSCIGYFFYKIYINYKKYLKFVKMVFQQVFSKSLIADIINLFYCLIFVLFISTTVIIFIPKNADIIGISLTIAFFLLFNAIYLWLLLLSNKIVRYIFAICAYLVVFLIIGFNEIVLLTPFIGKFASNKFAQSQEPLLDLITFAYTILMALVLFSLQKTARKNSIVPS